MSIVGNLLGFMGYYSHSRGKYDKAGKLYQKGLNSGMTKPNYRLAYGVLLLKTGDFQKARDIFSKILLTYSLKEKTRLMAKMNLALAYWKLDELDTAIEMLEEIQLKYNNTRVYQTLGYMLIEKGDLEAALKYNLQALDYDDEDPVILDNLGQTYYKMGDIKQAKKYFLSAEEKKEKQADTLYYLACIHEKEGDIEAAKQKLEKALTCNITPLNTVSKQQIEDKLNALEN